MPYIPGSARSVLTPHINALLQELARMPEQERGGAFDYVVFTLLTRLTEDQKYHVKRGFVGDLIWALMEWYRRFGIPYEDAARARNGDIT